jgi:type II secretory pathway component PulF
MAVSGKSLARWYRELAQNLRAGFPLNKALVASGGVPLKERLRLADRLSRGDPLDRVLQEAPRWMPRADRAVIATAAASGRLVDGLDLLSRKHAFSAGQRTKAILAMLYPIFVIHVGVVLVPLRIAIMEDVASYLRVVASFLLPLWGVIAVTWWGARQRHAWLRAVLRVFPLLRGYSKNGAWADLSFLLAASVASGQAVDHAWLQAGEASGERRLARLGQRIAEEARQGTAPSDVLARARGVPEEFVSLYSTGERSGQLEENLHHLGTIFAERSASRLQQATTWYPTFMILLVAGAVAFVVIRGYLSYLEEVLKMLDM